MNLKPREHASLRSSSGQIVVEYVMLLIVAVTLGLVMVKTMVARDPGEPGFVVQKWNALIQAIGSDKTDGTD